MKQGRQEQLNLHEHAVFILLLILMGVILFHWLGNSTAVDIYGTSALHWVARKWYESGGTMSHGWLVPLASCYFVYRRRHALRHALKRTNWTGFLIVIASLLLHWAGVRIQQSRFAIIALIGLLWAIPLFLAGWHVARLLIFPCAYLLFCIPWNFIDNLTVPLRILSCYLSEHVLNGLGVAVAREGTLLLSATGTFALNIADPCSGLRSLIAMLAISSAYGLFLPWGTLKRWLLFALSIPLAVIANVIRICTIALIATWFNSEKSLMVYHDYSGYVLFPLAIILLSTCATWLGKIEWGNKADA
jgi:exosortase